MNFKIFKTAFVSLILSVTLFGNVVNAGVIKVGVVIGGNVYGTPSGQAIADQLNDDTFFDFDASYLSVSAATSVLSNFDALVLGCTGSGCSGFTSDFMANARSYLENGNGGIITTGWFNYGSNSFSSFMSDADAITPISESQNYSYSSGLLTITQQHAITNGISDFTSTTSLWETSNSNDLGADVLGTIGGSSAIVVQESVGRSAYLGGLYSANSGYGTTGMRLGVEDQLLEQAVAWSAGVQSVPEPSTLAIFALGMIGLASRRFKKQS